MKNNIALYLAGMLSLGCAALAQAQASGATEKAVAALEEKWAQAERENNYEMAAPLLADKFVLVGPDGKAYNRTETIADGKATKIASIALDNQHVTVFGDTAIARGDWNTKGTDPEGKPFESHARWTDTWVKMPDGKWQCVASHGSTLKM